MARELRVEGGDVVVRLTGWGAVAALKREVRIPVRAVRTATVGRFDDDGWRLAGTNIPFTDVRAGRFRRDGRRQFLSFGRRSPLLVLECDRERGAPYDVVALELEDPEDAVARIEAATAAIRGRADGSSYTE